MSASPACPSADQLREFALGIVPEADATAIVDHLEHCIDCEQTVDSLDLGGDTVISAILRPRIVDPYAEEQGCRKAEAIVLELGRKLSQGTRQRLEAAEVDPLLTAALGPYQLLEKIGSGGMGTVYKAVHRKLDKVLALKVLPKSRTQDASAVARFEREMRAIGKLDHPHIVRATDAGESDGTHFLVMELVDGADLSTIVKQHGPLPVAEACEAIRQAAMGLQEAHRHGMVHRDIKPSNLMLARSPRPDEPPVVKILDLGLARLTNDTLQEVTELTSVNQVVGTIDYMAPEQLADTHNVDIRADIYSLGATLYKLLTGDPPFRTAVYKTSLAKLAALAHEEIEPIETRRGHLPDGLAAVVQRMLQRNPVLRFATPQQLAEALKPYCAGQDLNRLWSQPAADLNGVQADALPLPNALRSKPRKQSPLPWLAGAGVLVLFGIIILTIKRPDGSQTKIEFDSASEISIIHRDSGATDQNDLPSKQENTGLPTAAVANRRAVSWALGIGGNVTLVRGDQRSPIRSVADLPDADFVLEIDLNLNQKVDDAGLENLRGATAISYLILNGTRISTLEPLTTLTGLETLNCSIDILDANDLRTLIPLRSLNHLSVGTFASQSPGPVATIAAFEAVCQFPQVDKLGFGSFYYPWGDADLTKLRQMPQLATLHIGSSTITDEDLLTLPALPQLSELDLSCPQATGAGLARMASYPKLNVLGLLRFKLRDKDLESLPALPNLYEVNLFYFPQLTGVGLSKLKVLPQLTVLRITESGLTDTGLYEIATHGTRISWLGLNDSRQLTNNGLESLVKMPQLTRLELAGSTQITDDAVPALARIPSISFIGVSGTGMTPRGVAALRMALPNAAIVSDHPAAMTERPDANGHPPTAMP